LWKLIKTQEGQDTFPIAKPHDNEYNPPMNLIDTHCHLDNPPLGDDPAAVMARATARGVTRVIVPAYDLASWPAVLSLPGQQNVYAALGLHPWVADQCPPGGASGAGELIARLRDAIAQPAARIVAIGEIGLDTKIEQPGLDVQIPVLEAQLQLAVDLDLPVILHCRGAFDEMLAAVANHGGRLRGVLHAFSRSGEVAERFLKAGLHLGLGGAITRPTARRVRKAAAAIPLERIVLETDAPAIGLDGVLPENTEPQHVRDIAEALAELRGLTLEEIAEATTNNACRLFRLPTLTS
jgi:TatD DNase family protein